MTLSGSPLGGCFDDMYFSALAVVCRRGASAVDRKGWFRDLLSVVQKGWSKVAIAFVSFHNSPQTL